MSNLVQTTTPGGYGLLWIIAILSLLINIGLIAGILYMLNQVSDQLSAAADTVEANQISNFDIPVKVDETIPVKFTVEYKDEFNVPVDTTIPVSTSLDFKDTIVFPINEVIAVDTSVAIKIPILNQTIPIEIPIKTDIPVNLNIEVPIDYTIPVETEILVDLDLKVPVETEIPVDENIPVQLDFPVTVPLEDTELPDFIDRLAEGLRTAAEKLRLR
ncbi:MAG: hypothetical protein AAF902_17660 [Chloroflexota bacterium]